MRLILLLCMVLSLEYIYPQQSVPNVNLNDIFFSDSLHGCAVGNSGVILYSSDGGANWLLSNLDTSTSNLASIYFLNSINGFATGYSQTIQNNKIVDNNGILRTYDGGKNWKQIANANYQIWPITFIDSVTGFIAGNKAFISKTTDKGESWSTMNFINGSRINLFSIGFINRNEGWAAGSTNGSFLGVLLWTENGGQNWTVIDSSISPYIRDAQFVSTTTGFLASLDGIFKTTDGGTTWIRKYQSTFYGLYFLNEQIGWAVGYGGKIVKTIDGGETWILQSNPTTDDLYSVYFIDKNRGWAVGGWHTTILSTTDGGDNWNIQYSTVTSVNDSKSQPIEFTLNQNYPNPFNPSTAINYSIPKSGFVTLKIYDMLGNEVAVLVNGEKQAGTYDITFNSGNLSSGVYFYRITAGEFSVTKKMIVLK